MSFSRIKWTKEREQKLRKMALDGYSANEIKDSMGDISRGAVLGKASHLKIKLYGNLIKKKRQNGRKGWKKRKIHIHEDYADNYFDDEVEDLTYLL